VSERVAAAVLLRYGDPPNFATFDHPPAPSHGQVLVDVEVAGLNPVDVALGERRHYLPSPPLPYVPGMEAVGRVVDSAAPGVAPGDRVYVDLPALPHGTFASRTLAHGASAVPIRADADAALACALGIAGVAAFASVHYRAKLRPGETVVVLGATGVVGMIAIQVARLLGAGAIVAVGRDRQRLEATRALGATATVRIGGEDLTHAIKQATGDGADVVIDTLCGAPAEAALEAGVINARLVQLGRSAAETMELRSATVRGKAISIIGHANALTPQEIRRDAHDWLLRNATAGQLHIEVERIALAHVADAWLRQKASPGRKLLLAP
jgi:NADPH:quinone reductase-like Zn-dependent oxidoreductase